MRYFALIGFFFIATTAYAKVSYKVEYFGVENPSALKTIKTTTHLSSMRKNSPESISALRYRAESDIPDIIKILHAHGYYEASVQIHIEETSPQALVHVYVHSGPAYTVKDFTIELFQGSKDRCLSCQELSMGTLGVSVGKQISAQEVINAELLALQKLSLCGYPLASISDRAIVANGETKTVSIRLDIDAGPRAYFGELKLQGNTQVKNLYVEQKLEWRQGEVYSASQVEETQKALMDSGLFNSVAISHRDIPSPDGMLPMQIEVAESKHRSIYGGVSYQTYYGPGLTAGWEHRNIRGMGQKLSLKGDLTKRSQSGLATYLIPNFYKVGQDYVWEAEAMYLNVLPYSERSYSLTNRFEKRFNKKSRIAFGLEGEKLFVHSSALNGDYWLIEVPIFYAYNAADNLLNPTEGFNIEYKTTPSLSVAWRKKAYVMNQFAFGYYLPVNPSHSFVLAQQVSGGFFFSGDEKTIPLPKRFFGGSEEELRGYTYYSVCPVNSKNELIGGRSALYYTLEARARLTKNFGFVPFFDMGNVSESKLPTFKGKWLKSVGIGARYFSFIGPFRLDVGFPLNPRKGIDKKFRILVSIGQTF